MVQEWKKLSSSSTTQPLSLNTQAENKPIIELGLKVDSELQAYFQSDRLPASEFEAHAEKHFSEIAIDIDQGKTHALSVGTNWFNLVTLTFMFDLLTKNFILGYIF